MRLHVSVIGFSLGIFLSCLFLTTLLSAPLPSTKLNAFPIPAESTHLVQARHSKANSLDDLTTNFHNESMSMPSCPSWKPKRHKQVLLIAFHPEKTAGSSMARFFELQDKENGGDFEMMSPWDESWLLRWLGDDNFRAEHPRVFCHLHGKGAFYATRAFRRESMLATVQTLPKEIRHVIQADTVDPSASGFFEYLTKLLTMHAPRLEREGARVLVVPSWREPGQHFVSGLMFLDYTHTKFKTTKLGVVEHARRAVDALAKGTSSKHHEYYKPEALLLYYYGLRSPIVSALHNVTQVNDIAVELSKLDAMSAENETTDGEESIATTAAPVSFIQAYKHIYDFVNETSNVTLWSVSEKMDEFFLLLAYEVGFRLYEEETCLPLWDAVRQNANPMRHRGSMEENIVAGIGRTIMSPGASTIYSLVRQTHDALWNQHAHKFAFHQAAISRARKRFSDGVPNDVLTKRREYKMFLQKERFPTS